MNSKLFWMKWGALAALGALASSCGEAADYQPLEDDEDGLILIGQGLTKCQGGTNGDYNYCHDPACPCDSGEGDCNNDSQCTPGNFCSHNIGATFGFPAGYDVCVPEHCRDKVLSGDETFVDCGGSCKACPTPAVGEVNYCDFNSPCQAGEGNCKSDAQCDVGLFCQRDIGAQFGFASGIDVCIPTHCRDGVRSGDETGVDCGGAFCAPCALLPPGHPDYCRTTLCAAGEGDCDNDSECQPGLGCKSGVGESYGFTASTDVCVIAHCSNGVIDSDQGELGVDCGGADCLACENISWSKVISSTNAEFGRAVAVDTNGDVYIAGYFQGSLNFGGGNRTSAGDNDAFVAKFNGTTGAHVWSLRLGGTGDDRAFDVAVNPLNNQVTVTGEFRSPLMVIGAATLTNNGNSDTFVATFSTSGTALWAKGYGSTGRDRGKALAYDFSGGVYLLGDYEGTVDFGSGPQVSAGGRDLYLARLDAMTGDTVWANRYGGGGNDFAGDIASYNNTEIAIIGSSGSPTMSLGGAAMPTLGNSDVIAAKYNVAGAHLWSKRFGGAGADSGDAITFDADGFVILAGYYSGTASFASAAVTSNGLADIFVARLRNSGTTRTVRSLGGPGFDAAESVATLGTNIYLTGYFQDTVNFGGGPVSAAGGMNTDIFSVKLNANLQHQESQRFGATELDFGRSVATSSSGVFLTGSFIGQIDFGAGPQSGQGSDEVFLVRKEP